MLACGLHKFKKNVVTHWVSCNGDEYPRDEYCNWGIGDGKIKLGKKDLPADGYPYTYKYEEVLAWACCRRCSCEGKELND